MSRKLGDGRLSREQIRAINRAIKDADKDVDPVQPASAVLDWIRVNRTAAYEAWTLSVRPDAQLAYIRPRRARPSGLSLKRSRQATERTYRVLAEGVQQGRTEGARQGARLGAEIGRSQVAALSKWGPVRNEYDESTGPDPETSWVLRSSGVVARWAGVGAAALSLGVLLYRLDPLALGLLSLWVTFCLWIWPLYLDRRAERGEKPVRFRIVPPLTGSDVTRIELLRYDGRLEVDELLRPAERP